MRRTAWALLLLLLAGCAPAARPVVRLEPGPPGSHISRADGRLEAVAAGEGAVLFATSRAAPVLVATGDVGSGPRLAAFPGGRRAVVWEDGDERIRVALSADGGATWRPGGLRARGEVPEVAWLGDGRLLVVWAGPGPAGEGPLLLASSTDGGATFTPPLSLSQGACTCCRPALAVDGRGRIWLGYRTSVDGVKDVLLLRADGPEAPFHPVFSAGQPWPMRGCPRDGPSLAVSPDGAEVLMLWTRGEELFMASRGLPVALGKGSGHFAAADASGDLVAGWNDGHQTRLLTSEGTELPPLPALRQGSLVSVGPGRFALVGAR